MHEVKQNDVIRFGRIPFKITKLVLDVSQDKKSEKNAKEILKNEMLNSHRQMDSQNDSNYPLRIPTDNFEGGSPQQSPKQDVPESPFEDLGDLEENTKVEKSLQNI